MGRVLETPGGRGRIIGAVEDTRRSLTAEIEPTLYVHFLQSPPTFFSVPISTEGRPEGYQRPLQEAFWSVVYGIGVFDPLTFTVAPLVLIAVAVLAAYVPARRATRVDPMTAFRG